VDWDRRCPTDEERMSLAVTLARENILRGTGGPFGAAVFELETGVLVSVGVNSVVRLNNCTLHAEIVALTLAQQARQSYTLRAPGLPPHEVVTSCQPCAMCLGATLWSGVSRIVYAARREDAERLGFDEGPEFPGSRSYLESRGITLAGEVLRDEGRRVLELYRQRQGKIYNA
jgi:tRNA(Arg) A34 adenosine deaminase TadA